MSDDTPNASDRPVVLISGGSRGLGLALVDLFLAHGWRVSTFSRSLGEGLERRLTAKNGDRDDTLIWQSVDSTDDEALRTVAKTTARHWGRLDTLVNNAGIGSDGLLALMRTDDVDQILDVNLRAAVLLTQACLKPMIRQSSGSIVNISSVNGIRGHTGVAVYSATKAALDGMTRSLARELGPRNIRINSVAPGYFESDMVAEMPENATARIARRTPLGRLAQANEIAEAVYFLGSDKSGFITGQVLVVDGGLTC